VYDFLGHSAAFLAELSDHLSKDPDMARLPARL